jgi:glutathione synthase/RimK-type ligase-like ATP-grasp enzyme
MKYSVYSSSDKNLLFLFLKKKGVKVHEKWVLTKNNFVIARNYSTIKFNDIYKFTILLNYIQFSQTLGNKLSMYNILKNSNLKENIPYTTTKIKDVYEYSKKNNKKYWIVKPIDDTWGNGISIINIKKNDLHDKFLNNVLIQSYIENPILIKGLKFDIRAIFVLNQDREIYFFKKFVIRTSKYLYDLNNLNKYIHVTNLYLQKKSNMIPELEEQTNNSLINDKEFSLIFKSNIKQIKSDIEKIGKQSILEGINNMNNEYKKDFDKKIGYQIFGFDFIIDNNFKPILLEINISPALIPISNFEKTFIPGLYDITYGRIIENKKNIPTNFKLTNV